MISQCTNEMNTMNNKQLWKISYTLHWYIVAPLFWKSHIYSWNYVFLKRNELEVYRFQKRSVSTAFWFKTCSELRNGNRKHVKFNQDCVFVYFSVKNKWILEGFIYWWIQQLLVLYDYGLHLSLNFIQYKTWNITSSAF